MNEYLDVSGKAMLAASLTYDYARSAEKMTEWHLGDDNPAWKEGPYLSSGANHKQIDRNHPYCLSTSREFAIVSSIIMGPDPIRSSNGGVLMPLPPKDKNMSQVEPIISKLAIIEQFELFKEFLITFDGPYNSKKSKEWENRVSMDILELVRAVTDRRNDLTHNQNHRLPSMKEAVEYFYKLRYLAAQLYTSI